MVYRVFVEKKAGLDTEAAALLSDLRDFLGIRSLERLRLLNRYDAEGISAELFDYAVRTVFSEPQTDLSFEEPDTGDAFVFAVEYLPGQFDQRADSAAQCIQILSQGEKPLIRSARVYALYGDLSEDERKAAVRYVINPVEAREASLEKPATLSVSYPAPAPVPLLEGFRTLSEDDLAALVRRYGLAMDEADLAFCQKYFREEGRDPSLTELRVLDTYWSDHCRHTTFQTVIDSASFSDPVLQAAWQDYLAARDRLHREKPVCLMDLGTIAAKVLRAEGRLDKLDESEEINACTVKTTVTVDGQEEDWLLLFKNETHNHPTEIEPFGGAATCIGGAIRDPLSGRSYVYGAMRVTGAANPLAPVSETIPGKLPQRKLVTTAAAGYSSYGNQIGLATGIVDELYHPGYAAKRMEIGAVIAAAPAKNVRRERPAPGDVVILLGGGTGRDGIGGATGSSKAHDSHSVETCGAEVQKGNAPEERKLQRLFRNPEASRLIKRCNDFGAGGVSVAIGELADGLVIDLDAVPRKYEGLDGTELAISESQERMAVVVAKDDVEAFLALSDAENLSAVPVAVVSAERRLIMNWEGEKIVNLSRDFLDTNGADRHICAEAAAPESWEKRVSGDFCSELRKMAGSLRCCSRRGLSERFDSTIGAGSVLMPFGGRLQLTPVQAMVQKFPLEHGTTDDCSFMAWGFNPEISEKSPYHGAYLAVVESVAKLLATGAEFRDVYLSFQEYFERLGHDRLRWGKPLSALLGAFEAQMQLGVAAIGGKDSMSGSFEDLDVPPTLVSFAVTTGKVSQVISPEFKKAGTSLYRLAPSKDPATGLPDAASLLSVFAQLHELMAEGKVLSCYTPGAGGVAEAVMKMAMGNGLSFRFSDSCSLSSLFSWDYGAFLLESETELPLPLVGTVTDDGLIRFAGQSVAMEELLSLYEGKLEPVYPIRVDQPGPAPEAFSYRAERRSSPAVLTARPRVLIPVFPGTNCEVDSARAVEAAGAEAEIFVLRNLSPYQISESVDRFAARLRESQMLFIPGGFSGGDEPDGSGKFITAFFRNAAVRDETEALLNERGGLICGICNGFQALIKLGLVPYGRILDPDEAAPTLSFNVIRRHQSRLVRTRVVSNLSPWLALTEPGQIYTVPISHGEGRFLADEELIRKLAANGQIATQYVDLNGDPSMDVRFNPNGSLLAVEGIPSPDGRVFGKMGHSERVGRDLYLNVPGNTDIRMFEAAVRYFH